MHEHPMFKHLARLVGIRRLRINMSSFGGPTKKATHLYSSLSAERIFFSLLLLLLLLLLRRTIDSWWQMETTLLLLGVSLFSSPERVWGNCFWIYLSSWGYRFLGLGIDISVHNQTSRSLVQIHAEPIWGHQCIDGILDHQVPENLQPREMTVRYVNGKGENRVCGGRHLKQSQSYPVQLLCYKLKFFKKRFSFTKNF